MATRPSHKRLMACTSRLAPQLSRIQFVSRRDPAQDKRVICIGGARGRGNTTAAGTYAGDQAFLGGHTHRRAAAAALRRLQSHLLPAAAVLPEMRLAQSHG